MTQPAGRRRGKEPIAINIQCKTLISARCCVRVVEDLLKYILYQRGQIPVHVDILVREATPCRSEPESEAQETLPTDLVSRKKEIQRQKLHRKRQQWLNKVKKFLKDYNSVIEILRTEFESGDVRAVNVILGSSVMTGREIYSIKFPRDYCTHSVALPPRSQLPTTQLFRTLVTNEALLNVVNRPCGVQKVWLMLLKTSKSSQTNTAATSDFTPTTSTTSDLMTSTAADTDASFAFLIPRPEYSLNPQAQLIEINFEHSVAPPMDLTPTVGSGIIHNSNVLCKVGVKRSLYFSSPCVSQYYSCNNMNQCSLHYSAPNLSKSGSRDIVLSRNCSKGNACPPGFIDKSCSCYNRVIAETPTKVLKEGLVSIAEMPVQLLKPSTPSKELATRLGNFTFSDTIWYQIDYPVSGFKDMHVKL